MAESRKALSLAAENPVRLPPQKPSDPADPPASGAARRPRRSTTRRRRGVPGTAWLGAMLVVAAVGSAQAAPRFDRVVVDANPGRPLFVKGFADINGDGRRDIVLGTGWGVRWYQFPSSGNPYHSWVRRDIVPYGSTYEALQLHDLTRDGRPDALVSLAGKVQLLRHPGGAGTGPWTVHPIVNGIAHELRLADMDGDGKTDFVASRTRTIAFQNSPTAWTLRVWGSGIPGHAQDGLALLDIGAGKGAINIVGANSGATYWFENPRETGGNARTGTWRAWRVGSQDSGGPALGTLDVNGDGRMDIVQAPAEGHPGSQGLVWWQAPADRRYGTWTRRAIDASWHAVHWFEVADMNLDGRLDLVLAEQEQSHDVHGKFRYNNDRIAVLYNNGGGSFTQQVLSWSGGHNLAVADVDGDGDRDIVSANHGVYGAPNPLELFINRLR